MKLSLCSPELYGKHWNWKNSCHSIKKWDLEKKSNLILKAIAQVEMGQCLEKGLFLSNME